MIARAGADLRLLDERSGEAGGLALACGGGAAAGMNHHAIEVHYLADRRRVLLHRRFGIVGHATRFGSREDQVRVGATNMLGEREHRG